MSLWMEVDFISALSTKELKTLEEILLNKDKYNWEIQRRKLELNIRKQNETPEIRVNSVGSQVENEVIRFMSDPYIINRNLWLESIDKLERTLDNNCIRVYVYKFNQYPYLSWYDIGEQLGYTKSSIYRIRYLILEKFNEYIGMY